MTESTLEREWREAFQAFVVAPPSTPPEKLEELRARVIEAGDRLKHS